jgi:hypothetical protein
MKRLFWTLALIVMAMPVIAAAPVSATWGKIAHYTDGTALPGTVTYEFWGHREGVGEPKLIVETADLAYRMPSVNDGTHCFYVNTKHVHNAVTERSVRIKQCITVGTVVPPPPPAPKVLPPPTNLTVVQSQ